LSVVLPACNTAAAGYIAGFGSPFGIAALTLTAASGAVTNAPSNLGGGEGMMFQCRNGDNTWRQIASKGRPPSVTVAGLGVCGASQLGDVKIVTDANAPTYNGTFTGGGSGAGSTVPAFCDGALGVWRSH